MSSLKSKPSTRQKGKAEVSAEVTSVEEMAEVEEETSLSRKGILDAPGGGAELLQPIAETVLEGGTEVDLPATAASTAPATSESTSTLLATAFGLEALTEARRRATEGIEAKHRTPRPAEPAPAEAMGVGILSVATAASSPVRSGGRQTPTQCTVEESSEGARHSTGTQWVVPTIR